MNSLLSELPLSIHETWLLPQAETLCVIRYLEESHGAATSNGDDGENTKCQGQEEGLPMKLQPQPSYSEQTFGQDWTTGDTAPEPNQRMSDATGRPATGRPTTSRYPVPPQPRQNERKSRDYRTSGHPRATGRP